LVKYTICYNDATEAVSEVQIKENAVEVGGENVFGRENDGS